MDIFHLGHSSFRIKGKTASVITDPFQSDKVGFKFPKVDFPDIVTVSHLHDDHNNIDAIKGENTFVVDGPGEYEIKDVLIVGLKTEHDNKNGEERGVNNIYKITIDGVKILHLGDLGRKLSEGEIDLIGDVDILLIPTGGTYTIDAKMAAEVIAQIEPSIVIPMHYQTPELKLSKELEPVSQFLKEMGVENIEPLPKLTTSRDKLPDTTTVVVLE